MSHAYIRLGRCVYTSWRIPIYVLANSCTGVGEFPHLRLRIPAPAFANPCTCVWRCLYRQRPDGRSNIGVLWKFVGKRRRFRSFTAFAAEWCALRVREGNKKGGGIGAAAFLPQTLKLRDAVCSTPPQTFFFPQPSRASHHSARRVSVEQNLQLSRISAKSNVKN